MMSKPYINKNRQISREERRERRNAQMGSLTALCLLLLVCFIGFSACGSEPVQAAESGQAQSVAEIPAAEPQEDFENAKIEAALVEQGYFRDDIPMDYETQAYLRAACEETGVDYNLALAVIWRETGYRNVIGDDGASTGYMQVQERWHRDRMARLGVTDLSDPYSNFRVGCDYLAELMDKHPLTEALTAYNSGTPGQSEYAEAVIDNLSKLEGDAK